MEIIIGREEGARRLHCIADGREFNIGAAGSVPTSVSRKHCKIIVNGSQITVENLKPQNVTFIDGLQVFSKTTTADCKLQLGTEKYNVSLRQVIQLATGKPQPVGGGIQPQLSVGTFSLRPLKAVWEEYDGRKLDIQEAAARNANRQRLQGIFSMLGMCLGFIPGIDNAVRFTIIGIALLLAVYFFIAGSSNDTVQKQLHDLDDEYARKYKCPNPSCGKPFGAVPYRQIEFSKKCFACGCDYTH